MKTLMALRDMQRCDKVFASLQIYVLFAFFRHMKQLHDVSDHEEMLNSGQKRHE